MADPGLQVVATAGHVDHGKSALVLALTGTDPDRLAEEKRRGLTIDLGFAWTTLPSGREVGFVDVPGHERFIRNMLAGVGPVRLVLFVVAADEGWKPQSEEHLQIIDVLGVHAGVVALTKVDLVDETTIGSRVNGVRTRLAGTRLAGAKVIPCSVVDGRGIGDLRVTLDEMLAAAPAPAQGGRPRHFIDRVFTIRGAGTVVTGTLVGGALETGQEAEILPVGHRARIRSLQTHKRTINEARPVSRVAVNLSGTAKETVERGDVLTVPGAWRATSRIDVWIRTVRGLSHPLTSRGSYKLYAGSAERDARIRLYGVSALRPDEEAFARVSLGRPVVLDFKDGFVIREAGRRQTVAGGLVLDTEPPPRPGADRPARLRRRLDGDRDELATQLIADRGAIRTTEFRLLSGTDPEAALRRGAIRVGGWIVAPDLVEMILKHMSSVLADHHRLHPLNPGLEVMEARASLAARAHAFSDPGLAEAMLDHLTTGGAIVREGTTLRLRGHSASTAGREDADSLVDTVRRGETTPPSVQELVADGYDLDLIKAICAEGRLVRISAEIVITPEMLGRAEEVVRELARPPGLTVSRFREALGTSRKYALPILEHFDAVGITRRQGDVRTLRR